MTSRGPLRRSFRPQVFLFRTLVGIFLAQFAFLMFALIKCSSREQCPDLGRRIENLCNVAVATTLSLLGVGESNK
jgi:hypothetical protein